MLKKGRKPANLFKTMSGIWWILITGAPWNQLPAYFGKWNSVYRFFSRWTKRGLFRELLERMVRRHNRDRYKVIDATHIKVHQDACHFAQSPEQQGFGKTKGGRNSKLSAVTNSQGKLLNLKLVPGNQADIKSAVEVLGNVRNKIVIGDKGYDSDELRNHIFVNGGTVAIPPKKSRTRFVLYSECFGRMRYVVENYFCRIKRYRRIDTRYDRRADNYLSFVFLASSMDWLK
ncbi:IS5 family transposase [Roseibacillus persicicus]|uniref:IS5 family transposase n=1 Tax=Roseibacillus persicicus TaxID=454148 RepID=UPI00280FBB5F|nr:IS5 family transposase [Roseibacillus persicicus]MDQ8192714.1 IS5 family transposase [Roseibacillus persicicus]